MDKENVRKFWLERAKKKNSVRSESQVNFDENEKTANLRVEKEIELLNKELILKQSDVIVDLGAGNGRFSIFFAPKVNKVVAVEYIETFAHVIKKQADEHGMKNVEVINSTAENFCKEHLADVVFVSGLLHYLNTEQYIKTIDNITKTLKNGGILFLRETISVLPEEYSVDKYSEELDAHYYSLYRISSQHIEAFERKGFKILKYAPFFEDGSILNKRLETRLYYFIFKKTN